jgi:hypothetical protein
MADSGLKYLSIDVYRYRVGITRPEPHLSGINSKEGTMGIIFPGMNDDIYLLSAETGEATGFFNPIYLE